MTRIIIFNHTGDFAENKDTAKGLRISIIDPAIKLQNEIVLDFKDVTSATQSFIHALISETIRIFGVESLELINFMNCNTKVQTIIEIVVDYVQDGIFVDESE